jgi:hypothetical protein
MGATASMWNQGKLEFFLSLGEIFLEMSPLRMLRECNPFAPVFGCSWPLSSFYSLERVCLWSLRSPHFLLVLCPTLMWRLPICTGPSCHMAFPFTLEILNHCYDVLRIGTLLYVRIRHSVASYNLQYYLLHFPLTSLEHPLFLFVSDLFWAPYIRARNMQDSRTAFLSPVFGICWPV